MERYWFREKPLCPFDQTKLGSARQQFKSNKGDLRLKVWTCPLCENQFIEYKSGENLIRRFPEIKCRYLDVHSREVSEAKREEQRISKYVYSLSPGYYRKYKYLLTNYNISKDVFCECFSESGKVYDFFLQQFNRSDVLREYMMACSDPYVPKEVQEKLKEYEEIIVEKHLAEKVKDYFLSTFTENDGRKYLLDDEQARAIATRGKYILTSARAGSGKTRVIVSKVVYLIEHEKVDPSQILVLAFNKNVPVEIEKRINELDASANVAQTSSGTKESRAIDVTRTFHSLAYRYADENHILQDAEKHQRSKFVRAIIEYLKETDPAFGSKVYESFRAENQQINRMRFKSESDYYNYVKSLSYLTLKGENVKSEGEKWIADFLYEHGIAYEYEHCFFPQAIRAETFLGSPNKQEACQRFLDENSERYPSGQLKRKTVKPDFYLPAYGMVWEHWGINEFASTIEEMEKTSNFMDMTWSEYRSLMYWKRNFWSSGWRKHLDSSMDKSVREICRVHGLIETSITDIKSGRQRFEKMLTDKLDSVGIKCVKRSEDELIREVWNNQITRLTQMMVSYIDKFEQHYAGAPIEVFEEAVIACNQTERAEAFSDIGLKVLKAYFEILPLPQKPIQFHDYDDYTSDFNIVLAKATQNVRTGKYDDELSEIRYLLIDEYQDFSELFYRFIREIIGRNPNINLFCVGDSWQAINRFMGADTVYFDDFSKFFESAKLRQISTNYRTAGSLVELANDYMSCCGITGSPSKAHSHFMGTYSVDNVEDIFLERREGYPDFESDYDFLHILPNADSDQVLGRYLKRCVQIIKPQKGKDVLILSRMNIFRGHRLKEIETDLRKYLKQAEGFSDENCNNVRFKTMHASKGDEADTVIIWGANERAIPKIHPDSELYEVFGETPPVILQDEQKLFYVAMTRAKYNLHILYDGKPSRLIIMPQ